MVLMVALVGLSDEVILNAEAKQGGGVYLKITGSSDICGLMLCSEYPGGRDAYDANWFLTFLGDDEASSDRDFDRNHRIMDTVSDNSDQAFVEKLDVYIHKFELGKITVQETMMGIKATFDQFSRQGMASDVVRGVGEKLDLYDRGTLSAEEAIESVHLTAEPQNIDPEFIAALDEHVHKFELGKITADTAIQRIIQTHADLVSLHVSTALVDAVGKQIKMYQSGGHSLDDTLDMIHDLIEEFEAGDVHKAEDVPTSRVMLPNIVDMPSGSGIPGCENDNTCYVPTHLSVAKGTTVTWVNSDTAIHTVTAGLPSFDAGGTDYPGGDEFDSDLMYGGDTFEHIFDEPGRYDYYCLLHPWMIGSVTVE